MIVAKPRAFATIAACATAACATAGPAAAGTSIGNGHGAAFKADPLCEANYGRGPFQSAPSLRFGIDPESAGTIGTTQSRVKPVNRTKALAALRALRPRRKELVLRVNRLFESDGASGIARSQRIIDTYTRAGFDTELQVRYHPDAASGESGNIAAWTRYVRHVVDAFGSNPHLVAMTITNEINVKVSPNTSDGAYPRAEGALIQGIIAAHREAQRRGFKQLKFGFTYSYRFQPAGDAAMFSGLKLGGKAFREALGFVGVDFYPGLVPGRAMPIPAATTQMLGVVRRCLMPLAGLGTPIPIWITESGYDTPPELPTDPQQHTATQQQPAAQQQRAALLQIVDTIRRSAGTFGVTDFRWFGLRDNLSTATASFETDGLLTDSYRRKPSFAAYRDLIARFGAARAHHWARLARITRAAFSSLRPSLGAPNGKRVHAGMITLKVKDTEAGRLHTGVFVGIAPTRGTDNGLLDWACPVSKRCDFVELKPWRHHPRWWIYTAAKNSFPWATTPGKLYWQAQHADCFHFSDCLATSKIGSFRVVG